MEPGAFSWNMRHILESDKVAVPNHLFGGCRRDTVLVSIGCSATSTPLVFAVPDGGAMNLRKTMMVAVLPDTAHREKSPADGQRMPASAFLRGIAWRA
jgi:hypothetical protein